MPAILGRFCNEERQRCSTPSQELQTGHSRRAQHLVFPLALAQRHSEAVDLRR